MDNIFGKEDSGNESEHVDIEEKEGKDSPLESSGAKDAESMDVDNIHVKVCCTLLFVMVIYFEFEYNMKYF